MSVVMLASAFVSVTGLLSLAPVGPAAPPPSEAADDVDASATEPAVDVPAEVTAPSDAASATASEPAGESGPEASRAPDSAADAKPSTAVPVGEPLPPAPAAVPVSSLRTGAWRGRGWFQIGLDLTLPIAGQRPARGNVRSAAGGVNAGWRPRPWLGLGAGLTTFFHDAETRIVENEFTALEEEASDFGRMTLFDVPQIRLFVPTQGRVEPWVEAAATMGVYHEPWGSARWAAGARLGAGVGFWLGPSFSLDLSVAPRMLVVDRATGWMIQTGFGATIHW